MSRTKSVLLSLWLLGTMPAVAQTGVDTLALAKSHAYKKDFATADALLSTFQQGNPDRYTLQLHAQVCYWMQAPDRATALYQEGLKRFPNYPDLKLDYGRFLFHQGDKRGAEKQLRAYLIADSLNAEANLNLGYLALWKGNVTEALSIVAKLEQAYPGSTDVARLARDIDNYYAPSLLAAYEYLTDAQNITANSFNLEAGMFRSAFFAPNLTINSTRFQTANFPSASLVLKAGNTIRLGYGKTLMRAEGGLFSGGSGHLAFTGTLALDQQLVKGLRLLLNTGVLPYQYTNASIERPFTYAQHQAALDLNVKEKFLAKAGIEMHSFADGNTINTAYGWLLLPVVHTSGLQVKTGLSLSVANSEANTFTSSQQLPKIITSQGLNTTVPGVYAPYFTPQRQQVQALLGSLHLKLGKSIQLDARGSYGFKAEADNPVLKLEMNNQAKYTLGKYFYRQAYTPYEAEVSLQAVCTPKVSLSVKYNYSSLFFYTRSQAGLQLTHRFTREKNK